MRSINFTFLFIFLSYLVACGGTSTGNNNENHLIDPSTIVVPPENISTNHEGTKDSFSIFIDSQQGYTTKWDQIAGPLTFFTVKDQNTLEYVSPNVSKNQRVIFSVKITKNNVPTETRYFAIDVKNRPILPLTSAPDPNVFSNANYRKHTKDNKPVDQNGIPLFIQNNKEYYYPVSIGAYAYDLYNNYTHSNNDKVLKKFLNVATWLKDNCIYTKYGFCSYRSHFPLANYKLTNDWTTAMGQGQAISSLIAAHYLTGDNSYGQVAYDAVSAFQYPISAKGLAADFNGHTWYEEYGSEEMPTHVLNGFLFALSGVRSFNKAYNENYAQQIFDTGVNSLKDNLHLYDFNHTSRYDYSPLNQLASTKTGPDSYHELHIFQLAWLYQLTQDNFFKDYAQLFLKQDMGSITSVPVFQEKSQEILSIEASHTIDKVNFGTDKLIDANWTWKNYWSTYKFPATLNVTINENILDEGVLEKIIITSVTKDDFPQSFDLYEITASGTKNIIKSNITLENTPLLQYSHNTGNNVSYTVVFDLNVTITSNKLLLEFSNTHSGIIKLRELDIQYPRESLMKDIINRYQQNF